MVVCMILGGNHTFAQQDSLAIDSMNLQRMRINKMGMSVLGGWAIGNMAISGAYYFKTTGSEKYYHQMNAMWNVVNIAIAIPGFVQSKRSKTIGLSLEASLKEQKGNMKGFLINAGIDVAYIGTGAFLEHYSPRIKNEKWQPILNGWGQSMIVQGAFLMVFDVAMYLMLKKHADHGINKLLRNLQPAPGGLGFVISF